MMWGNSLYFVFASVIFLSMEPYVMAQEGTSKETWALDESGERRQMIRSPGDVELVAALPEGMCKLRRSRFLRHGCTDKESPFCTAVSNSLTKEIMGNPACLDYPCEGYGNPVGFFLCNATCVDGRPDGFGICGGDDICCLT